MKFNKRKEKRRKGAQGLYQVEDYSWTRRKKEKIVNVQTLKMRSWGRETA